MIQEKQLLTRKEVAVRFEMSEKWIARHETQLGLGAARVDMPGRVIRYRRVAVESILARCGVSVPAGISSRTSPLQGILG